MRRAALLLAAVAAAAPGVPARAAEGIPAEVARQLADSDPKVRGEGLKALRERVDAAAVRAALPFLDDPDPYCRDYASWTLLPRAKEPAAVRAVLEGAPRCRTAAGRLAAADALAAMKDGAGLPGLLFLSADRDPRVRETALDGIGRAGPREDAGADAKVRAALADPAPGVRAAALEALARREDPGAEEAAVRALGDADRQVRAAAAALAAGRLPERFAAAFPSLASDPDWGVRLVAASRAAGIRPSPPVETLAALLEDDRMRVADAAHDSLRALSGLELPPVRRDWADWWNSVHERWRGPSPERPVDAGRPSVATYHGLPFRSDALLFVVDLSGSMDEPLCVTDPRSRIAVAREELARTLNAMPDAASADLLAFSLQPERALGRIRELGGGTRDRIRRWLEKRPPGRAGDMGAALAAAILDGEADTVILLGDGAPTAGDCLFRERIRERVRQCLRLRPVALHAVAFGGRPQDRRFLEDLASMGGGRCVER